MASTCGTKRDHYVGATYSGTLTYSDRRVLDGIGASASMNPRTDKPGLGLDLNTPVASTSIDLGDSGPSEDVRYTVKVSFTKEQGPDGPRYIAKTTINGNSHKADYIVTSNEPQRIQFTARYGPAVATNFSASNGQLVAAGSNPRLMTLDLIPDGCTDGTPAPAKITAYEKAREPLTGTLTRQH